MFGSVFCLKSSGGRDLNVSASRRLYVSIWHVKGKFLSGGRFIVLTPPPVLLLEFWITCTLVFQALVLKKAKYSKNRGVSHPIFATLLFFLMFVIWLISSNRILVAVFSLTGREIERFLMKYDHFLTCCLLRKLDRPWKLTIPACRANFALSAWLCHHSVKFQKLGFYSDAILTTFLIFVRSGLWFYDCRISVYSSNNFESYSIVCSVTRRVRIYYWKRSSLK